MSLEKLEELMTPEDFREYQRLYSMKEDVYSLQWYAIQDMMQKILAKYDLYQFYEFESLYDILNL